MDTLSITKYVGAAVAVLSAVVGIYNKVSAGQWRRLTKADWIATFLILVGSTVGIVSLRQQDQAARQSAEREVQAQTQRHRAVLAQNPLRNLAI